MVGSKFLKVKCPRCRTAHVVFGKASTRVRCKECNTSLVRNNGGKAQIRGVIEGIL